MNDLQINWKKDGGGLSDIHTKEILAAAEAHPCPFRDFPLYDYCDKHSHFFGKRLHP